MNKNKFTIIKNTTEIFYTIIILIVGIMSLMVATYIIVTTNIKNYDLSSFGKGMDILINMFVIFSVIKIILLSYEIFKPEVK